MGLWVSFFLILAKKNSQVCQKSNLSVQRKNVKKNSWTIGFSSFLDFHKKNLCLQEKPVFFQERFLAGLSKLLSTCPEEHFQSTFSERKSWKLQDFRIIFEVFGTMAEKFFRVGKTKKDVQGNSLKKSFLKREYFAFFPILINFLTSGEKLCQICETRNLRIRGSFWGKTFFEIYLTFHTSLDFDPKNAQSESLFTSCHNCNPRVQRHFWFKKFFF